MSIIAEPCKMSDAAAEWDRRKAYLTRCLFEDLPLLSPIPERIEPDQSEIEDQYTLPELIIEKEKNRHDESDEFYQQLEKKMLKLYRKLFLCQHNKSSVLSICSLSSQGTRDFDDVREESDNESTKISDDDSEGDLNTRVTGDSTASNELDESFSHEEIRDESLDVNTRTPEVSCKEYVSFEQNIETEEDSDGPLHEIITTEAMIHSLECQENEDRVDLELNAPKSQIKDHSNVQQIIQDWDEQTSYGRLSTQDATIAGTISPILINRVSWRSSLGVLDENVARLVAKQAITQKYSKSSSYEFGVYDFSAIEVMRELDENKSRVSIAEVRHSSRSSMEPEIDRNLNVKEVSNKQPQFLIEDMSSDVGSDEGSENSDTDFLNEALRDVTNISTPILTASRKRLRSDCSNETEQSRKRAKYKSYSNKTQQSRGQLPINYFYGTPKILNLCRCKNHICEP